MFQAVAPIGNFFGLMPLVKVFTTRALVASLTEAGIENDYRWQQGKNTGVLIVAKKAQ